MKEVYIIEKDGNCIYYKIPKVLDGKIFDDEIYNHEYYYRKYIKDKNIKLENEKLVSFEFAEYLSKLDIASIIVENKKMLIFLPKKISKEQSNWFINAKNAIRYFEVSYGYNDINDFKINEPKVSEGETTKIKDFYKYIKLNIQKEGEDNEYRKTI